MKIAIVAESPVSRIMARLFVGVSRLSVAAKVFLNHADAEPAAAAAAKYLPAPVTVGQLLAGVGIGAAPPTMRHPVGQNL